MSDPKPQPEHYLFAEQVVDSLLRDMEIQFQTEGDDFPRDMMQKHVNERAALITTKKMLLDQVERLVSR